MARRPLSVSVSPRDPKALEVHLKSGVQAVGVVRRALALIELADGKTVPAMAGFLPTVTPKTIRSIAHRYEEGGLARALYEKQRPGAAHMLSTAEKQRVIAMVCSDPPEGQARWTIQLIVEEAIKRKLVPRVGRETIRVLLVHHDLKPWREKHVVRSGD